MRSRSRRTRTTKRWGLAIVAGLVAMSGSCALGSLWIEEGMAPSGAVHAHASDEAVEQARRAGVGPRVPAIEPGTARMRRAVASSVAERLDFETAITELTAHAMAVRDALASHDQRRARTRDDAARALLGRTLSEIADAPERSLGALSTRLARQNTDEVAIEVLTTVLRAGLEDRFRRARDARARARFDNLVSACLDCLSLSPSCAERLGAGMLASRPYLGTAHETRLFDLLTEADDLPFLRDVVGSLLRTLWANLIDTGARSADEIAALALRMAEGEPAHRREAALLHLLTARREEHRRAAIERARDSGDRELCTTMRQAAASSLPLRHAVAAIAQLESTSPGFAAWARLGLRHPVRRLTAEYRVALNRPGSAATRRGIVQAIAAKGPEAESADIEFVAAALRSDPSDGVRCQALLTLGSVAGVAELERAILEVLRNPDRRGDPGWHRHVIAALQDAAARLPANRIRALARMAAASPNLSEESARRLGVLLRTE